MGEKQAGEKRGIRLWRVWAPAVTALTLCAMTVCFAAGQLAPEPLVLLPSPPPVQSQVPAEGRIDLNTASLEELDTLPGVTSVSVSSGGQLAVDYDATGVRQADILEKIQALGYHVRQEHA